MSDTLLVTLPNGEDVRLVQDGNLVTVWRWVESVPFTDRAAWVVAGEFTTEPYVDELLSVSRRTLNFDHRP